MTHEHGPDTLTLIRIDHNESYFGLAGPDNDKASTADNDGVSLFINLRDERDLAFEIDVEEESHLPLREAFLWREKAPLERLRAGPPDRREHLGPVVGTKRPNLDLATIAEVLNSRIIRAFLHEKWFPISSRAR